MQAGRMFTCSSQPKSSVEGRLVETFGCAPRRGLGKRLQLVTVGLERGLVELEANPAHRRSHLVQLTAAGQTIAESMSRRETDLLEHLRMPIRTDSLRSATDVLRTVRELLARPDVQHLLAATRPDTTFGEALKVSSAKKMSPSGAIESPQTMA